MTTETWVGGSGDWNTATNWSPAQVPLSTQIAVLGGSANYIVTSGQNNTVKALQLTDAAATLDITGGIFATLGVSINDGAINVESGATLELKSKITNNGTITLDAGSGTAQLVLDGSVTFNGTNSVVLSDDAGNSIVSNGLSGTLNLETTISGAGTIGDSHLAINVQDLGSSGHLGVIDANGTNALTIDAKSVKNFNVIESTGSGGLVINSKLNNTGELDAFGGNITVNAAVTGFAIDRIDNATLDFASTIAATQTIGFFDATNSHAEPGTLILGKAQTFKSTIEDFNSGAAVDLQNFAFSNTPVIESITGTGAKNTNTIVTVKDGSLTAKLALLNSFAGEFGTDASQYALVSDHTGPTPGTDFQLASHA